MTAWTPALPEGDAPIYERLVDALRADIAAGVLTGGARLPPQRDLAHRLGLGLGTVTRAYVEAEKAGLVSAHVGRGSFVNAPGANAAPRREGPINLAQNIAPGGPAGRMLSETLQRLRRRPDLIEHLDYSPAAGFDRHRRAAADWLGRSAGFDTADWTRLVCCAGAQQGLALALGAAARPGETVLCEASTFHGVKALATHAGYRLQGVAMDAQGAIPEALEEVARRTGARVAILLPTLQNPTGRIMSLARREAVAALARRLDLTLIEDDIYGAYAPDAPPPLAVLAPERVFHVSGVSKTLAPGLRAGFVIAPDAAAMERILAAMRAIAYAPPGFGALIASQWIEDGTADAILAENRAETTARLGLAQAVLGGAMAAPASAAVPHVWLPMSELEAERLAGRALRGGVEVTRPSAPVVEPGLVTGVRLALGAASDRAELEAGLTIVASALADAEESARPVI